MRVIYRLAAIGWILCALAGCATKQEIVSQIEKGSVAIEEANNRLLLLNVVRAYHRRPMHFLRVSELKGPMGTGAPTFTVPTPFGSDFRTQVYNLSTSIKVDQPIIGLQLLDNQEFYRGLTAPVKWETVQYFLEQGWPHQMVLHLFVREIEEFDSNKIRVGHWVNYPENDSYFSAFQAKLSTLAGCEWTISTTEKTIPFGPALVLDASTLPDKVAALKAASLQLSEVTDAAGRKTYQPHTTKATSGLKIARVSGRACPHLDQNGVSEASTKSEKAEPAGRSLVLTMRSTEAMVYYLGELSRRYLDGAVDNRALKGQPVQVSLSGLRAGLPPGQVGSVSTALFVMERDIAAGTSAVEVGYEGATYSVPKAAGRSMHVLSLLTQLMALHNKATEPPTTQTVRVIN